MSLRNWFQSLRSNTTRQPARRPGNRLGVQQLEAREVPAVDLVSAVGLGNDAGPSEAYDVATDAAGNSYKTGYFSGTLDFDPAHTLPGGADVLTSAGNQDIFVAKYAPDDSLVWAARMGGAGEDRGQAIDVDAAGNVYVTGQFSGGTAQFGSTSLNSDGLGWDGFVVKLNSAGTVQWAARWGQPDAPAPGNELVGDRGLGVDTDSAGNVYVVGTRRTAGAPQSTSGYDILKFSPIGGAVSGWPIFLNTNASVIGADLAADPSGNVFVTGQCNGPVDYDPSNKVVSMSGVGSFVLKLTSAGKFGWACVFASAATVTESLARDGSGNIFVGGKYSGTSPYFKHSSNPTVSQSIDVSAYPPGGAFIAKLKTDGTLNWYRGLGGDNIYSYVRGLATDTAGNIYATGNFRGTIDLDPGAGTLVRQSVRHVSGTYDSDDVFVLKLTSAGSLAWAETFGSNYNDVAHGIAVDPSGLVHLAGGYSGTVDFDPDPVDTFYLTNPTANRHLFFVKLRQS